MGSRARGLFRPQKDLFGEACAGRRSQKGRGFFLPNPLLLQEPDAFPAKADAQRNRETMFWSIPDFPGQKARGDRHKERLELTIGNLVACR